MDILLDSSLEEVRNTTTEVVEMVPSIVSSPTPSNNSDGSAVSYGGLYPDKMRQVARQFEQIRLQLLHTVYEVQDLNQKIFGGTVVMKVLEQPKSKSQPKQSRPWPNDNDDDDADDRMDTQVAKKRHLNDSPTGSPQALETEFVDVNATAMVSADEGGRTTNDSNAVDAGDGSADAINDGSQVTINNIVKPTTTTTQVTSQSGSNAASTSGAAVQEEYRDYALEPDVIRENENQFRELRAQIKTVSVK